MREREGKRKKEREKRVSIRKGREIEREVGRVRGIDKFLQR